MRSVRGVAAAEVAVDTLVTFALIVSQFVTNSLAVNSSTDTVAMPSHDSIDGPDAVVLALPLEVGESCATTNHKRRSTNCDRPTTRTFTGSSIMCHTTGTMTMTARSLESRYELLIAGQLADVVASLRELTPEHRRRLKQSRNLLIRYMTNMAERQRPRLSILG